LRKNPIDGGAGGIVNLDVIVVVYSTCKTHGLISFELPVIMFFHTAVQDYL